MRNIFLKNKTVVIVGGARSGLAVANVIRKKGGKVKLSEIKSQKELNETLSHWEFTADDIETGGHSKAFLEGSDLLIISPGVPSNAPVIQWAHAMEIPVMGEIEFAWHFCQSPIIAVTGSNGKTTVTTLIAEILKRMGRKVFLCGNIGLPFSQIVLETTPDALVVLETSSFQLETIRHFRPKIAVFLNFSQNHLDRHSDMEDYFSAKKKIFLNQTEEDIALLNFQDEKVRALRNDIRARVVFFNHPTDKIETGLSNPNALAALKVASIIGISSEEAMKVIRGFKGVEHRLEFVRELEGVRFVNDSKATTVEAGRWALETLKGSLIMIAGGKDKNSDFSPLRDEIQAKVKKLILIGEAREKLKKAFGDIVPCIEKTTLKDAVYLAFQEAVRGDCIVLCPMCASFDMFKDYEERGKVFKEIVLSL